MQQTDFNPPTDEAKRSIVNVRLKFNLFAEFSLVFISILLQTLSTVRRRLKLYQYI